MPSTWLEETKSLSVWMPPALVAALPPIVLARWLEGSGAKWYAAPPGRSGDGVGELRRCARRPRRGRRGCPGRS